MSARQAVREYFEVPVPAGDLLYPSMYEPHDFDYNGTPRYGAVIPVASLDGVLDEEVIGSLSQRTRDDVWTVNVRTKWRPEVHAVWDSPSSLLSRCDPLDALVHELARLDARNVGRDRVFYGWRVTLEVAPYEYSHPSVGSGTALALRSITVYL